MSAEKVREYLKEKGMADRITVHQETIDTVEHAAIQVGCSEAEIAKTLTFLAGGSPVMVVMAGDGGDGRGREGEQLEIQGAVSREASYDPQRSGECADRTRTGRGLPFCREGGGGDLAGCIDEAFWGCAPGRGIRIYFCPCYTPGTGGSDGGQGLV